MKLLINTTSPYARTARICLLEKGFDFDVQIVNPWADDPDLLKANTAARVPALLLDDGRALTECLLIGFWAEAERPEPSLLQGDRAAASALAGVAMGVVEAAVHTLVGRVITSGVLTEPAFDSEPVGQRRRRSMITGLERMNEMLDEMASEPINLGLIVSIVALDYVHFRFPQADWIPAVPRLDALRTTYSARASFADTTPRD